MRIEERFRDLKCDRFGCAFHYSLTRTAPRPAILLLLQALATFVAWLTALASDADRAVHYGGIVTPRARRHYALLRIGGERLRQTYSTISPRDRLRAFTRPPQWSLRELEIPG